MTSSITRANISRGIFKHYSVTRQGALQLHCVKMLLNIFIGLFKNISYLCSVNILLTLYGSRPTHPRRGAFVYVSLCF